MSVPLAIDGARQILSYTIPWSAMAMDVSIPSSFLADGTKFLKCDGTVTLTAAINFGGFTGINAGSCTNPTDVANKAYVDLKTAGIQNYTNGVGLSLVTDTFSVNYGTTAGTAAVGDDARILGSLQITALGVGVLAALQAAVGSIDAFIINGGALGTPSSANLVNAVGLPIATGVSGLGAGIGAALIQAITGSGALVGSVSPTLTGTLTAAAATFSGVITANGGIAGLSATDALTLLNLAVGAMPSYSGSGPAPVATGDLYLNNGYVVVAG